MRNIKRKSVSLGTEFDIAAETLVCRDWTRLLSCAFGAAGKFGNDISEYVQDIDPMYWTVYANLQVEASNTGSNSRTNTRSDIITRQQDTLVPTMKPCPLFMWSTTNFVESDNYSLLVKGVRDAVPLEAIKSVIKASMDKFSMIQDQIEK